MSENLKSNIQKSNNQTTQKSNNPKIKQSKNQTIQKINNPT